MKYSVKDIYYTLQGEGANVGRPAVFCRFAGCNLWSGQESDRASAQCRFCDTDFVGTDGPGGGIFATADGLAAAIIGQWPATQSQVTERARALVVFTGGEPLLQLDEELPNALRSKGWETAVETNGTLAAPTGLDWVCVSPKAGTDLVQDSGNEIKLVFPQPGAKPGRFESLSFEHFFLQPMDGPDGVSNTRLALDYCLQHPQWRLSLQTHKLLGIP